MAKVTSKLQVTVPKALATRYGIRPGDDIVWQPGGDAIRLVPGRVAADASDRVAESLAAFDQAEQRRKRRERGGRKDRKRATTRGWTREGLYGRGGAR